MQRKVSDECHDHGSLPPKGKPIQMNPTNKSATAAPAMTDAKPSRAPKRAQADTQGRLTKRAKPIGPAKKAATPERGTKTAKILALLKRPGGASLEQLRKVTGWQAHSVRAS
jgi:hypothetical protein